MIPSAITSQKRATRPCTMTSPLCPVQTSHPEGGVAFAQDLLCTLVPGLILAPAAGAMTIIMWLKMNASQAHSPSAGICTLLRETMVDVSITVTRAIPFLPPSPLQRQRKVSAPTNRELRQQRIWVSHLISLFQIGNWIF
jgi:hypothetical protein